jgi:hypothetical protein
MKITHNTIAMTLAILGSTAGLQAWDHPAHMTTAAIAFNEIERANPELIAKLDLVFMKRPDASPSSSRSSDMSL